MDKIQKQETEPSGNEYFTRIPDSLFRAARAGELPPSEFDTMCWLHKWADWSTGITYPTSAKGLETGTGRMYCEETFQDALHSLSLRNYITRQMVQGSHKSYVITISNYAAINPDGTPIGIVNVKQIKTRKQVQGRLPRRKSRAKNPSSANFADEASVGELPTEASVGKFPAEATDEATTEATERTRLYTRLDENVDETGAQRSSAAALVRADPTSSTGNPGTGKPISPSVREMLGHMLGVRPGESVQSVIDSLPSSEPVQPPVISPVQPKPDTPSPQVPPNPPPTGEAAKTFFDFLGKTPSSRETKDFDALEKDSPDLGQLLRFALIPGSKWAKKIGEAEHPFAYLKSTLEHIREAQEKYEWAKAQAAAKRKTAAETAPAIDTQEWDVSGLDE